MQTIDEYKTLQEDKYLDSIDYRVSTCCGAKPLNGLNICSACNNRCYTQSLGDYNYTQHLIRKNNEATT